METLQNDLQVNDLAKRFMGQQLFQGVAFRLAPGASCGIIGPNGAGKTTLLNILSGLLQAEQGTMSTGGTTIDLKRNPQPLPVGRSFQAAKNIQELSPRQNILLAGREGWRDTFFSGLFRRKKIAAASLDILAAAHALMAELGAGEEMILKLTSDAMPLKSLSLGEQRFVELIRLFLTPRPVYLLDEPTTHLSAGIGQKLGEYVQKLSAQGHIFLVVSHEEAFLRAHTDQLLHLSPGENGVLSPTKGYTFPGEATIPLTVTTKDTWKGALILELQNVEIGHAGKPPLCSVDLEVSRGEVVVVVGQNGTGKSSLLKTLIGLLPPLSGRVIFDKEDMNGLATDRRVLAGMAYVFQDKRVFARLTTEENLAVAFTGPKKGLTERLSAVYDRLPLLKELRKVYGGLLSGGQQQLLAIGRALMQGPGLLLLDEPFAGLSPQLTQTVAALLRDLAAGGMAVLVIEHDPKMVSKIGDRILTLTNKTLSGNG